MRLAGYPMALVLLLTGTAPMEAGVGMPQIGSIQIGPHRVHVLNDSIGLRKGRNMLTVHVPGLPPGHGVTLHLHGPRGELVEVPLRSLHVVGDPGAGHGALTAVTAVAAVAHERPADGHHVHGASPPAPAAHREAAHRDAAHGSPHPHEGAPGASDHDATAHGAVHGDAPHGPGHGGMALAGYAVRGTARLPSTGAWRALVTVSDGQGPSLSGELPIDAIEDGPNPLYLGLVGLLTGGSVLYGVIQRRRGEGRP
jgi:hypothetical protein